MIVTWRLSMVTFFLHFDQLPEKQWRLAGSMPGKKAIKLERETLPGQC